MPEKQKKNSISINKYKTKRELNNRNADFRTDFYYLVVAVVAMPQRNGSRCMKYGKAVF